MKIMHIEIDNFRNLSGVKIDFDNQISYIVGENGIGKSNLIYVLEKIFGSGVFNESDFSNVSSPIKIEFTLRIDDEEIGMFDVLTDSLNHHQINIIATQESPDDYIQFVHKESQIPIRVSTIRSINLLHYDSMNSKFNDLSFEKAKGPGAILTFLLKRFTSNNDDVIIKDELKTKLIGCVNGFAHFQILPLGMS